MKLEDQVCSLELAKRLKELGVKQESLFSWGISLGDPWNSVPKGESCILFDGPEENMANSSEVFSAFTVAELGEMLPWDIVISRNIDCEWHVVWQANGKTDNDAYAVMGEKSEADARAKMLIYLIENGLMSGMYRALDKH